MVANMRDVGYDSADIVNGTKQDKVTSPMIVHTISEEEFMRVMTGDTPKVLSKVMIPLKSKRRISQERRRFM